MFFPFFFLWFFPFLVIAAGIFLAAYLAYHARLGRERAAVVAPYSGPDPADELARINREIAEEARTANERLAGAARAIEKGVR